MTIIGWKAGFGTEAAMERLGTSGPLFGVITERSVLEPGSTVSLEGWANPLLEPELAAYLDADGGIAAIGAAIELVDLHSQTSDVAAIVGGNIYHRHVLLGGERANGVEGLSVRVYRDGALAAETDEPERLNGSVAAAVRQLRDAVGDRVRPGDVVIAGSTVAPIPVEPGQTIRYELAPLGSISISFAPSASSVSS
jgi:2-oxo-3-hexenedioate decarboxylase